MQRSKKILLLLAVLTLFYGVTHLWGLTQLPVFADEAIYIRWAQLAIDDWQRYAFFPLNDGKTPLAMWALIPFQFVFTDQLFAARLTSVFIGFFQMLLVFGILQKVSKRLAVSFFGAGLTAVLPFWFFHHRMALTEALLLVTLSTAAYLVILVGQLPTKNTKQVFLGYSKREIFLSLGIGVSIFAALFTKIPAVLALPSLFLVLFLNPGSAKTLQKKIVLVGAGMAVGVVLFSTLALHPVFPQLFSRGGDFLYPVSEVLGGRWFDNLLRVPRYMAYFFWYLTPPVFILILIGLFSKKVQRKAHVFFWAGVLFCLPIVIMGKVVHPRYFYPAVLFFTGAAAFGFEAVISYFETTKQRFFFKAVVALCTAVVLSNLVTQSAQFILLSVTHADATPFVLEDRFQYLEGWSSGHGIKELDALLIETAETRSVALATEGSFGTLPDGILLYQHRKPVDNLYVEGVGFPSETFPEAFVERAQEFDLVWYVANQDRVANFVNQYPEVARYCRPFAAPCLVVWDVTAKVKQ